MNEQTFDTLGTMELVRGIVRVEIENLDGEVDDETDTPLMRFTVSRFYKLGERVEYGYTNLRSENGTEIIADEDAFQPLDDASYCTMVPATITPELGQDMLAFLMDKFYDDVVSENSVMRLAEGLTYITEDDFKGYAKN